MVTLDTPPFRIAHIAAADLTAIRREQLMRMTALFQDQGVMQIVIVPPEANVHTVLSANGIDCRIHPFGRLFDLKAEKTILNELEGFAPHILQSHSGIASWFAAEHLAPYHAMHVVFADPPDINPDADFTLQLHPADGVRYGNGRSVAVPPITDPARSETAQTYLTAYKALLTG